MRIIKAGPLYDDEGRAAATLLRDVREDEPVLVADILLPSGKHPNVGDVVPEWLMAAFDRQAVLE